MQTFLNHTLERSPSVFETEWYRDVAKTPECDEGCCYFIWSIHLDLVVLGVRIQERHTFTSGSRINDLIYARQREVVLRADLIELLEVNTH